MSKQGDAAYAWFLQGYNCSQSVVAAFAPQLGLTEETALRLSAGFGAGIGRMREVCGAFCGVVTVLSMVYADPTDPKDKSRIYALVQQAAEQYRTRNSGGSIICRELLAKAGTAPAGGTAAEDRSAPARSCAASAPTCVQNLLRRTRRDGTDYIRRMRKCSLNNWN